MLDQGGMAGLRLELRVHDHTNHIGRHAEQGGQCAQSSLQMRAVGRKHRAIHSANDVPYLQMVRQTAKQITIQGGKSLTATAPAPSKQDTGPAMLETAP